MLEVGLMVFVQFAKMHSDSTPKMFFAKLLVERAVLLFLVSKSL